VPWAPLLGWSLLAATPCVVALLRGAEDVTIGVALAALVLGASVASALDDPAQVTVASVPTPLSWRRLVRISWSLAPLLTTAAALATSVVATDALVTVDAGHLTALAAATALTSLAIAAHLPADAGFGAPGTAASGCALLAVLVSAMLSQRFTWAPMPGNVAHTGRWWLIAACAGLVALPVLRDPASRRLLAR
jgi:hypothetical protein